MLKTSYKEIRSYIEDGDLIAVKNKRGILSRLTRIFTRSDVTHVGIAIWDEDGLYVAELNSGRNHKVPLSQLEGIDFDVYAKPENLTDIRKSIAKWLRHPIEYGYLAFFAIGLLNWFGIKLLVNWRRILVCSGWCVAVYEDAGWPKRSRIVSPEEVTQFLKLKCQVRK